MSLAAIDALTLNALVAQHPLAWILQSISQVLVTQLSMHVLCCRQCSSGLQAVADVAAAIRAGFYSVGLAGGVEAMSQTPMAWEGGVNPRAAKNKKAMSCLIPMGQPPHPLSAFETLLPMTALPMHPPAVATLHVSVVRTCQSPT